MKRIAVLALTLAAAVGVLAASANAKPAPKATGSYGYSIPSVNPSLERYISFAAIANKGDTCGTFWDVTTITQFTFFLGSQPTPYTHWADLTQNGEQVGGDGGYPYPSTATQKQHWNITSGSIVGDTLTLHMTYDRGAVGDAMTMSGTIAEDGSIAGTWSDTLNDGRTGTFTAPAGSATPTVTYCGKGTFYYHDANGDWYFGVVKRVSIYGQDAWYAAKILCSSSDLHYQLNTANYVFVHVYDGGEPGIGVDTTGGQLMTETNATNAVIDHLAPSIDGVPINDGNIQVH